MCYLRKETQIYSEIIIIIVVKVAMPNWDRMGAWNGNLFGSVRVKYILCHIVNCDIKRKNHKPFSKQIQTLLHNNINKSPIISVTSCDYHGSAINSNNNNDKASPVKYNIIFCFNYCLIAVAVTGYSSHLLDSTQRRT